MFLLRLLLCQCLMLFASQAAPSSIADFAAKAEKRQPLSVVFFGGSLTFGANASDPNTTSYRGLMTRWLREKYPNTPITFHDASIGGTGSQLGMFRLERDVLSHRPDLVFLDFTVNDGAEETDIESLASYERIVRELMATDAAVMPVLMLFKWHAQKPDDPLPPRHTQHLKLAQCYRLPAADVLSSVRTQMKTGQSRAPMVRADRMLETGRSKKGRSEPSDLISEVTKLCSTIVPMTMPSTMAATG